MFRNTLQQAVFKNKLNNHLSTLVHKRTLVLENLKERCLLQISGNDVTQFVQGLITNDIQHLEKQFTSVYTLFLNTKGRIFLDSILYRTAENDKYLIECDTRGVEDLNKHLKIYRLRKKIDIVNLKDDMKIWALFDPEKIHESLSSSPALPTDVSSNNIFLYKDPRLLNLGLRIITPENLTTENLIKNINIPNIRTSSEEYRKFRYILGIGEGVEELPPGKSFPLEANCDYLHGISFHKGCYIGQELTARTQHTGIVRKRLMPIMFQKPFASQLECDSPIYTADSSNTNVGKLRGNTFNVGLGLLRITKALDAKILKVGNTEGTPIRPFWWPKEAVKDRTMISKTK